MIFWFEVIATKEPSCVGPAYRADLHFGYPSLSAVFGLIWKHKFISLEFDSMFIPFMYNLLYYLKSFK